MTREQLGVAALAVIGEVGATGVTRAAVAERAGVSARATYRLAPSTDDLISVAVTEWQRRWAPPTDTGDWRADFVRWGEDCLAHMRDYPGLVAASLQMRPERIDDGGTPTVTAAVDLLVRRAGLSTEAAIDACGVLNMHCLAWELTLAAQDNLGPAVDSEIIEQHREFRARGFRRGLRWIVDGIAADAGGDEEQ
ncbi:MAG: helix-turn-helix domain-containing protein [Actinomycetota bacterium]